MLTTHFIKLCQLFKKTDRIENFNMKTLIVNDEPQYTYKIKKGISEIKGGVSVLQNLNYPIEIIEKTKEIMSIL